jgi:hypothetical protein
VSTGDRSNQTAALDALDPPGGRAAAILPPTVMRSWLANVKVLLRVEEEA